MGIPDDVIKQYQALTALCIKISVETKHTIFLDYYGNVNCFTLSVKEKGWENLSESDYFKVDGTYIIGLTSENIEDCITQLEKYKEEK